MRFDPKPNYAMLWAVATISVAISALIANVRVTLDHHRLTNLESQVRQLKVDIVPVEKEPRR